MDDSREIGPVAVGRGFLLLLLPLGLYGQVELLRDWTPPAGEARTAARGPCSALRSLTGYDFSIVTAEVQAVAGGGPEFCRVVGLVQPEVRFEIALPAAWNGRLVMIGNGGYAGENVEAPGRAAARDEALRKGFAFTQTNTGHDAVTEPLGTFAVSPQKLLDYAFRAVHVTAMTAKSVAARYYGSAPKRSYFVGCSTGGRQALIAAQRFPEDFDGILSMAPVLDFTNTMVNYARVNKAWETAPVSAAKLRQVGEKVLALCDEKDGVKDGLIEDPRRCSFDPAADLPRCTAVDGPDCFTEAQIGSLKTLYSDMSVGGTRVFPGWPVGAEVAAPDGRIGWEGWLVRENGPSISQTFGATFFQYLAYPGKDPNLRLNQFDPERDYPRLTTIRRTLDATDPDLTGFRDRGGKLLMTYGWADPALNPKMGVEYYESAVRKMGPATRDFFRLFMMPGVFHCAGGPGCDSAPRFAALVNWVEQGKAPDVIPAEKRVAGKLIRSRPLCMYPAVATYAGAGSTDDAANFRCSAPQH